MAFGKKKAKQDPYIEPSPETDELPAIERRQPASPETNQAPAGYGRMMPPPQQPQLPEAEYTLAAIHDMLADVRDMLAEYLSKK